MRQKGGDRKASVGCGAESVRLAVLAEHPQAGLELVKRVEVMRGCRRFSGVWRAVRGFGGLREMPSKPVRCSAGSSSEVKRAVNRTRSTRSPFPLPAHLLSLHPLVHLASHFRHSRDDAMTTPQQDLQPARDVVDPDSTALTRSSDEDEATSSARRDGSSGASGALVKMLLSKGERLTGPALCRAAHSPSTVPLRLAACGGSRDYRSRHCERDS